MDPTPRLRRRQVSERRRVSEPELGIHIFATINSWEVVAPSYYDGADTSTIISIVVCRLETYRSSAKYAGAGATPQVDNARHCS